MKIPRNTFFMINNPMIITLGIVEEFFNLQITLHNKGSLLLPLDNDVKYHAKTEVILNEISDTKNILYDEFIKLKLQNQIIKEKNSNRKILLFLYYMQNKNNSLILTIPYNTKTFAEYLNITQKELNSILKNLIELNVIEKFQNTYIIKNLEYIITKLK